MLRALILAGAFLTTGTTASNAQLLKLNCQTNGPNIMYNQNSKNELESTMGQNGCRYSYTLSRGPLEKAVIMKDPTNGQLSQVGEFSFFYKPKPGFKGKDNFTVYLCGSGTRGGSGGGGCARVNYNVTVQ